MASESGYLSDEKVATMRDKYADLVDSLMPGESRKNVEQYLASEYGVSRITVMRITSGQTRKKAGGRIVARPSAVRAHKKAGGSPAVQCVLRDEANRVVRRMNVPSGHTLTVEPLLVPMEEEAGA